MEIVLIFDIDTAKNIMKAVLPSAGLHIGDHFKNGDGNHYKINFVSEKVKNKSGDLITFATAKAI